MSNEWAIERIKNVRRMTDDEWIAHDRKTAERRESIRKLLRRENQKKLLELKGKVEWEGDLNVMRGQVDHGFS